MSTQSEVRVANEHQRLTRLRQSTQTSLGKTRQANAVVTKPNWQRILNKVEQDIERALAVMDHDSGKMMNYRQLRKHPKFNKAWATSSANKFGRLASGVVGRIKGMKTIRFIHQDDVPPKRRKDITCGSFQCNVHPKKIEEPNRTRFVAGEDRINYPGEVATPTADMLVAKILFNIISTQGARFMTLDISNFYLMTPLKQPGYIRVKIDNIPKEIINEYKLREIANKQGMVCIEVTKGMYGLPQAGLLTNKLLEQRLNKHGYFQSNLVPGLWKHTTRPISFTFVVDDFGVKYIGKEHAEHLMTVLQEHYQIKADWTGTRYIGIHIAWDYEKGRVHLHMPGYVQRALKLLQHIRTKKKNNHSPTPQSNMEPKYNLPNRTPRLPLSTPRKRNSSKKYAASSSSADKPSTAQF
jgi:hypothetical protein